MHRLVCVTHRIDIHYSSEARDRKRTENASSLLVSTMLSSRRISAVAWRECTCQTRRYSMPVSSGPTSASTSKSADEQQKDLIKQVRKSDWKRRQVSTPSAILLSIAEALHGR